ncbi:MAG: glycoside hydrolase family 9 protein [Bacteroidota bacterium]
MYRLIVILAAAAAMLTCLTPRAAGVTKIAVCQAGYAADQVKTAVAVVTNGSLSDLTYQVIRASDNAQVYGGSMTAHTPSGWTRGETYYKIDFSGFTAAGDYMIRTNGVTSRPFTIADNPWVNHLDEMVEFYRLQRCGTDTGAALPASGFPNRPSAETLHDPCHMDDAKKGSESGENVDMTGGWHDAGDNNKYQGNTGWVTGALAITFLRHPNATFDYDANGVPDLLDEARWGAENLLKIQTAAGVGGGLYDTIDAPNGNYYAWKYPTAETNGVRGDSDDRVGHTRGVNGATNALTYDAAMKSAGSLAAVARAFASRDAAFAADCRNGAIAAYNWALANAANVGGNYSISDQNNTRLWAAVQLYLLTNDTVYGDWLSAYVSGLSALANKGTNYWDLQPLALAEYYPVAGMLQNKVVSLLTNAADTWRASLVSPFGVEPLDGITFGVNEANMSKAADAYRLYEISGDPAARDAAVKAVQWTFGVNPWDISWVSGIGANYTTHLHTRLDVDAGTNVNSTIVMPGAMVCGPIWADTLNVGSPHPWYEDRALARDGEQQWRYNEYSISIQYALLDLVVSLACRESAGPPPGAFNLVAPANGAAGQPNNPTLSWEASDGALSYTLTVDDDPDFSSPIYARNVGNVTSVQVTGLNYEAAYYWRVVAHNLGGDTSAVNNGFSFTTRATAAPPEGFSLTSPADGATGVVTNPTLNWAVSLGATSYTLVVDDNSDFSSPLQELALGKVTSAQVAGLANLTTYFWQVIAHNAYGDTVADKSFSFTTLAAPGTGTGLMGEYYDNKDFTALRVTRVDPSIDFDWGAGSPDPSLGPDTFSCRWTGQIQPLYSETYTFYTYAGDGVRLWIDNKIVIQNWTDRAAAENSGLIALEAGRKYDLRLEYYEGTGNAAMKLSWSSPHQAKEIVPRRQLYPAPAPTRTGGITIEAENMSPLNNFYVENRPVASGGKTLKLNPGATGTASFLFTGSAGSYTIDTYYFDENDGSVSYKMYINNVEVDAWLADKNLGSPDPVGQTLTSRSMANVSLAGGDVIKFEAVQSNQEWGRLDKVVLTLSGTTMPPPVALRYEAETAAGLDAIATFPSGFSGAGIGVRQSNGTLTWEVDFPAAGTYDYTLRCNDYSGIQSFTVQIDGVEKGTYAMTHGDKAFELFTGSFGTAGAGTHTIGVRFTGAASGVAFYCDYLDLIGPYDATPPVTTASPTGWQRLPFTVVFTGTDESGVARTFFGVDEGAAHEGVSYVIGTEGSHQFSFWSVDQAGNVETAKAAMAGLDLTPPEIRLDTEIKDMYSVGEIIRLDWEASDVLSGIVASGAVLDGATLTGPDIVVTAGAHILILFARDAAGNETSITKTFGGKYNVTVEVKPEAWNANTGVFTVSIQGLPIGYDAGDIAWAECDGARAVQIKAAGDKIVLMFRRDEVTVLPLDTTFVLTGRFVDGVWFEGTDEAEKVL